MPVSSPSSDPLERVLATMYEEYRSRLHPRTLERAITLARGQAMHLRMENRPRLVETEVREYLESLSKESVAVPRPRTTDDEDPEPAAGASA
jgi:hypothetical protein